MFFIFSSVSQNKLIIINIQLSGAWLVKRRINAPSIVYRLLNLRFPKNCLGFYGFKSLISTEVIYGKLANFYNSEKQVHFIFSLPLSLCFSSTIWELPLVRLIFRREQILLDIYTILQQVLCVFLFFKAINPCMYAGAQASQRPLGQKNSSLYQPLTRCLPPHLYRQQHCLHTDESSKRNTKLSITQHSEHLTQNTEVVVLNHGFVSFFIYIYYYPDRLLSKFLLHNYSATSYKNSSTTLYYYYTHYSSHPATNSSYTRYTLASTSTSCGLSPLSPLQEF